MRNTLATSHEIATFIEISPKRADILKNMQFSFLEANVGLRTLCPTRWTVNAESLKSILTNYQPLQLTRIEAIDVPDSDTRLKIRGIESQIKRFSYFFY